jgi:hypothetical protein
VCTRRHAVIETIDIDFFDDWPTSFTPAQDPNYLETERVEARQNPPPYHPVDQDSDYYIVTDILNEHSPDSDFVDPHEVPHPYE